MENECRKSTEHPLGYGAKIIQWLSWLLVPAIIASAFSHARPIPSPSETSSPDPQQNQQGLQGHPESVAIQEKNDLCGEERPF